MIEDIPYDLELLSEAVNYQRWIGTEVSPYLGKRILEVGAGIGNMSSWLPVRERLILSESDPAMLRILRSKFQPESGVRDARISCVDWDVKTGYTQCLLNERLDTVVSFNVLEHLEDDISALKHLCGLIRSGDGSSVTKRVLSFVPAHPWAFGALDAGFGHYRRYSVKRAARLWREAAPDARMKIRHFNFPGLFGWFCVSRMARRKRLSPMSVRAFERLSSVFQATDSMIRSVLPLPLGQSMLHILEWNGEVTNS